MTFVLSFFHFANLFDVKLSEANIATFSPKVLGLSTGVLFRGIENDNDKGVISYKVENEKEFDVINAKSYLVGDVDSGTIIIAKNIQDKLEIGSITKLLTALVAYENLNLESEEVVTAKDYVNISPKIHLKIGDNVKVINLLESMLVGSANDSASMLARLLEEKTNQSIKKLLNDKANAIGMNSSKFDNPFGFDSPNNYSTIEDVFYLVNECLKLSEFDFIGRIQDYSFKTSLGNEYKIKATNKLLSKHPDIFAVKTGQTPESGGSMAVRIVHSGRRLALIVLGSSKREKDIEDLRILTINNVVRN